MLLCYFFNSFWCFTFILGCSLKCYSETYNQFVSTARRVQDCVYSQNACVYMSLDATVSGFSYTTRAWGCEYVGSSCQSACSTATNLFNTQDIVKINSCEVSCCKTNLCNDGNTNTGNNQNTNTGNNPNGRSTAYAVTFNAIILVIMACLSSIFDV